MTNLFQDRRIVFYDIESAPYRPIRDAGVKRSVFKVKPQGASNRVEDGIHTEDCLELARAVLIDGLAIGSMFRVAQRYPSSPMRS